MRRRSVGVAGGGTGEAADVREMARHARAGAAGGGRLLPRVGARSCLTIITRNREGLGASVVLVHEFVFYA